MYSTFNERDRIRYTQSKDGKTRFVFLFDEPGDRLILNKLTIDKAQQITMLGSPKRLAWKFNAGEVEIRIPKDATEKGKHVWVLKVE
jgi:hypothetical protein